MHLRARRVQGLKVPLQKRRLQIGRAADAEDGVGAAASLHQAGHRLPQLQVVQVTGRRALRSGHAGVDPHLQSVTGCAFRRRKR